jgi:hypothetical protein
MNINFYYLFSSKCSQQHISAVIAAIFGYFRFHLFLFHRLVGARGFCLLGTDTEVHFVGCLYIMNLINSLTPNDLHRRRTVSH